MINYVAFTKWDKIKIKGPLTVQQLIHHLESSYEIKVLMVTYGAGQIYPYFGPNDKKYMSSSIVEAIEMVSKKTVPKQKKYIALGLSAQTKKEGIYCVTPIIRYQL